MQALIASIWAAVSSAVLGDVAKLISAWAAILGGLPAQEAKILVDAKTSFLTDVNAGKGIEQAAADAWTTFYNEEKGTLNSTGSLLFKAFLSAFGVPQSA